MKRFIKAFFAAAVCIVILLTSCACAKLPAGVLSFEPGSSISSPVPVPQSHRATADSHRKVSEGQGLSLLFDDAAGNICVYDEEADFYWTALPFADNASAAVLSAALVSSEGRAYLNSQDNCAAFGAVQAENTDGGVRVVYTMGEDQNAAAAKDAASSGGLFLRVPVTFTLADGVFQASVNCAEIELSEGYVLEWLSLLPYFGAYTETQNAAYSSFLLVPDGCGALIHTEAPLEQSVSYSYKVYPDAQSAGAASACAGCFAVGRGNAAAAACITQGAALATVRAVHSTAGGWNAVYPEFTVTEGAVSGGKHFYALPYQGAIAVSYRLLRGTGGAWIPAADACREALIRSGALSAGFTEKGYYPLNVEFIMSADGRSGSLETRFAQAQELAGLLKAKGVGALNLILNGCFSGGVYAPADGPFTVPRMLGGKKGLSELCAYTLQQDAGVYFCVNMNVTGSAGRAAKDLQGGKYSVFAVDPLTAFGSAAGKNVLLSGPRRSGDNVSNILEKTGRFSFSGYAVQDAAKYLYGDASVGSGPVETQASVADGLGTLASRKQLLVSGGNFYALRYASLISELPMSVFYEESGAYEAVPFLQALLHGSVVYSGAPVNTQQSTLLGLLKCVEYGAAPSVRWVFQKSSPLFYELTYTDVADFYVRAASALKDLSDCRITGHEKLDTGLYTTTFDGGAAVIVNYNNYSVNVGNLTVPPYDFIRIN